MGGRISYYGNIVRDSSLIFNLDAAKKDSYPGNGTIWRDLNGSGNFATLTNGPVFSTEGGGCIVLDGIDDFIPTNVTTNYSRFTVAAWVKPSVGLVADGQYIINKNSYWASTTDSWPTALSLNQNGLSGSFFVNNGTCYNLSCAGSTTGSTQVNNWNYVVGTYDMVNVRMYVNGVLTQSAPFTSTPPSTGFAWTIGRGAQMFSGGATSQPFFKGSIGSVMLYNRGLSATEVLQNYNALKGRYNL
jgi:hypothetical protein